MRAAQGFVDFAQTAIDAIRLAAHFGLEFVQTLGLIRHTFAGDIIIEHAGVRGRERRQAAHACPHRHCTAKGIPHASQHLAPHPLVRGVNDFRAPVFGERGFGAAIDARLFLTKADGLHARGLRPQY